MERPQLWNINTLTETAKKEVFYERLAKCEGGANYANVKDTLLGMMIEELPDGALETEDHIF